MAKPLEDTLEPAAPENQAPVTGRRLALLSFSALGVVYGDIGTSPLYAVRACFHGQYALALTTTNVLGILSLIFWSLVAVISIKYLLYVMHADNRGEGGILALMALIHPNREAAGKGRWLLVSLGIFGAALLYGDGTVTPAISVLSSVEGLEVATTFFRPYIIPITIIILILLFLFQRKGTGLVGSVFGPVMLFWFLVLAILGITGIVQRPEVLRAVNPAHAVEFFRENSRSGFLILGVVFLVVTGGEALYADMGHFGKLPIRLAWFLVVLPALLLNYFGQGALLMHSPLAAQNPFYLLAPRWALYPLVALSTMATVIASQAVISGAFSLTRQAIQLGYCPRMKIDHTSREEIGQVYIGIVNWTLMVLTIVLVIQFERSTNLVGAYGVAVSTTMIITTLLAYVVAREVWHWNFAAAGTVTLLFLIPDISFFIANLTKVAQGGWFPLLLAAMVYVLMSTWSKGRYFLWQQLKKNRVPVETFLEKMKNDPPPRVKGTAVFLTGSSYGIPPALLHQLDHNKVLHERVILFTFVTKNVPYVWGRDRFHIDELQQNFYRVVARTGFAEEPDIRETFNWCGTAGLEVEMQETSFFLARETIVPSRETGMVLWRAQLFAFMSRNALRPTAFFHIPHDRVVELGIEVEM